MKKMELAFARTMMLLPLLEGAERAFGITPAQLGIPDALLAEPMSLVPLPDVNAWYLALERLSGDPCFVVRALEGVSLAQIGPLAEWFVAAPDLATTLRRINYSSSALQSGLSAYGAQSGNIIKWCFDNSQAQGAAKFHDGCRKALLVKMVLAHYPEVSDKVLRLRLPGPTRPVAALERAFGCEVETGAPQTEIWLPMKLLARTRRSQALPHASAELPLDKILNLPAHTDVPKAFYELVNYSRHYGYPSLDFIAQRYELSRQQLQRRLHRFGWSFSAIVGYVLFNQATEYLLAGRSVADTAALLGYSNVQSFSKAFVRHRGLTPTQYQTATLGDQKSPH
ncbi:AraC family transcriptional regulator [Ferrimonas balearica]|uniref:AraC family transcriptional regulator n=1 Tax=Ferrimonas balearica TaxID=44012 RepID=UPI001C998163|nr:AraC family transcriptional regulator [Ferrimonas balearica]MBY5993454.1 AraC family transcriptional regulator [Ferrimonas balearica]